MWYRAESTEMPTTIDSTSSQVYVYVRKNINVEQREDENETRTVYVYDEAKIPKDIFEIFQAQTDSEARISDVEDILAEILGGDLV